jgi:hypothetical protein
VSPGGHRSLRDDVAGRGRQGLMGASQPVERPCPAASGRFRPPGRPTMERRRRPCGVGRRLCVGESLMKRSLFHRRLGPVALEPADVWEADRRIEVISAG